MEIDSVALRDHDGGGNVERGYIVWRDYTVDGETVKSPVDIEKLPAGVYRVVGANQLFSFASKTILRQALKLPPKATATS
ncbi:MAG: hypothetical protein QNK22_01350 [Xanthomonadales bacterium]|nr:hypothetical protein [Xanthomonadales bacterium]